MPICVSLEPPWVPDPNGAIYGKSFESCIPEGDYELLPTKWKGELSTWVMVSELLGVYHHKEDVPEDGGRWECKIHPANWVREIQGCNAPGTSFVGEGVSSSRKAFKKLMSELRGRTRVHLLITS